MVAGKGMVIIVVWGWYCSKFTKRSVNGMVMHVKVRWTEYYNILSLYNKCM